MALFAVCPECGRLNTLDMNGNRPLCICERSEGDAEAKGHARTSG